MRRGGSAWALLLAFSRCVGCEEPKKPDPLPVFIAFESLADGQQLSRASDTVPGIDGVQRDIALRVGNVPIGEEVVLTIGALELRAAPDGDRALFTEVTLPFGDLTLSARLGTGETRVTLQVLDQGAVCSFVSPQDGELLTVDRASIFVACEGIAAGETLDIGIKSRRAQSVTLDARGRATLEALALAEGANVLQVSHPMLPAPAEIEVIVDTGRCLAALSPPDGYAFLYDSQRDGAMGALNPVRQLRFDTSCAADSIVSLELTSLASCAAPAIQTLSAPVSRQPSGGLAAIFDAALLDGAQVAGASVVETTGRTGRALDNTYFVDTYPPQITTITPVAGRVVAVEDADPLRDGTQLTVHADLIGVEAGILQSLRVTGPDGIALEYEATSTRADALCFDQRQSQGAVEWIVDAQDGATLLEVTARDAAGNIALAAAEVLLLVPLPGVIRCTFVAPQDGDVITTESTSIEVVCSGIPEGEMLDIGIKDRPLQQVPVDAQGRATLATLELAEGANILQAAHPLLAAPVEIEVSVDSGRCLAALSPPDRSAFLYDAQQDGAMGMLNPVRQLRFDTSCAEGSIVSLELTSLPSCAAPATQSLSAPVAVQSGGTLAAVFDAALLDGAQVASASVLESGGRTGRALDNTYFVDAYPPRITLLTPITGSFLEVEDADPVRPGAQLTVRADLAGVEAGTLQRLRVTGPDAIPVDYEAASTRADALCFDQSSSQGAVEWIIDVQAGETLLEVTASDAAGNVAVASAEVFLLTSLPTISITSPASLSLLTLQADVDLVTPGLQIDVVVETSSVIPGAEGTLVVPGQTPAYFVFGMDVATSARVTLADGPPPDGTIDGIIARAALVTGSLIESSPVSWTIDATPPFLRVTAPREGEVASTTMLTVEAQLETEPQDREWRVFVNDSLAASEIVAGAGAPGLQEFRTLEVMLIPGPNVLRIEVDDRLGAERNTTIETLSVYQSSAPPTLAWVSLSATDSDGDPTNGFDAEAVFSITGAPGPILIDLALTDQAALAPDGTSDAWGRHLRTLPASGSDNVTVPLSLPAHEPLRLWARVTQTPALPGALSSAWQPFDATIDSGTPAMALRIVDPSEGARTNLLSLPVQFSTVATNKDCALLLDGGEAATIQDTTAINETLVLPLSAVQAGLHALLVRCDAGSGPFYSQRVSFDFLSALPVLAFVDAPGVSLSAEPGVINATALDLSSVAGFQHDIEVSVEASDGETVVLDVTRLSDMSTLASASAVVLGGRAVFLGVTLAPDVAPAAEAIRLELHYDDPLFGALTLSRNAVVDRVPPSVTLDPASCPPRIPRFNSYDDDATFDLIEWRVGYAATGVAEGSVLRTELDTPSGHDSIDANIVSSLATATIGFPVPSDGQRFNAAFYGEASDGAGNIGRSQVCSTEIDPTVPVLSFRTPRVSFFDPPIGDAFDTQTLTATLDDVSSAVPGVQVDVLFTLLNVAPGSTVRLCSTSSAASVQAAPACTAVPGRVIAEGTNVATTEGVSQVIFAALTLADSGPSPYGLAAEVAGGSGTIAVTPAQEAVPARSFPVIVDGVLPRAVIAFNTPENILGNDLPAAMQLGAQVWDGAVIRAEGAISGATLEPSELELTLGGPGMTPVAASLSSSLQGAIFGAAVFAGDSVRFTPPPLVEGTHVLTLTLTSATGNVRVETLSLVVDVTPPVLLVAQPAEAPYTCETPGTCLSPSGRMVQISLATSDDRSLEGGCVCVRTGSDRCLNSPTLCTLGLTLGAGAVALPDVAISLGEGTSQVVGEAADAAGNVTVESAVPYTVDTLATSGAPGFEVSPVASTCAAFAASGCELSFDDAPGDCHDDGSDPGDASAPPPQCPHWYASGVYRVTAQGTQDSACQIAGDDCQYELRLLGEPLDGTGAAIGAAREVYASAKAGLASDLAGALLETLAPSGPPGLDHATFWRLVLEVRDRYGNFARSAPRYVELPGYSGAVVSLQRGYDNFGSPSGTGPDVGLTLERGDALGVRHNSTQPATGSVFTTRLLVAVEWNRVPRPAPPRCVRLLVDDAAANPVMTLDAASVEELATTELIAFDTVSLPTDVGPYRLRASVHETSDCASATVGVAEVDDVSTTNALPAIVWNRAWLEDARFNAPGDGLGNTPGTVVRAIKGPGVEALGLLLDSGAAPGFQFGVARPMQLDVQNAAGGTVTVKSSLVAPGGTTSVTVGSGGPCDLASTGTCVTLPSNLTFMTSVSAGTPATTNTQTITATVCSRARDCVETSAGLQMKVNVDPPTTISDTLVCTGQSAAPSPAPNAPDTSAAYMDDPACAALCVGGKCDVRSGKAVVRFTAPGVAQSALGNVSGYSAAVAIIDATPSGSYEDACNQLVMSGTTDLASLFLPLAAHTILAPGATQVLELSGVPLHQRLCFALLARDDVGNLSTPSSRMRVSLLVPAASPPRPFARQIAPADDRPDDSLVIFDRITQSAPNTFVLSAITVGDMDGDGGSEFAVATQAGEIRIYSSKRTRNPSFAPASERTKPREIITPPPPDAASAQHFGGAAFKGGEAIAGGDFNGDGFADLALSSAVGRAPDGTRSGTVYVYFGSGDQGSSDPPLLRRADCVFGSAPGPRCPHVVIYGGNATPEGFFGAYGFLGWEVRAGRVHATSGPDDLVLADPAAFDSQGGVYVIRGGGVLFPAVPGSTTQVLDLRAPGSFAAQVTKLGPLTGCANNKFELSLGLADLDGDGIEDIAASYGNGIFTAASCGLVAEVLFWKGGSSIASSHARCDKVPVVNTAPMRNIGPIMAGGDWLLVRSNSQLRAFSGAADFFAPGPACGLVTSGSRPNVEVVGAPRPIRAFGAALDDSCNAVDHVLGTATDLFHYADSAAPAGDWNGDGQPDFYVSETAPRARVYVVTRTTTGCAPPSPPYRVIGELSGNDGSPGSGFGVHLFNAGNHAGAGPHTLGAAGRVGGGSNDFGVWLLR